MSVRKQTNKLLEMLDQGLVTKDYVIMACLKYMSEDQVADMMRDNDIIDYDDDNS
ncbi:MAG: hypothetical protein Unbinned3806contig1000_52 [Prokaryotic dsDNA virus sp.]|nr:MAG: hypothetical protein Unbinned3806contig1000_52 [Prokaryotic dsDNA virus sp.]